jgi:hypothetical protein
LEQGQASLAAEKKGPFRKLLCVFAGTKTASNPTEIVPSGLWNALTLEHLIGLIIENRRWEIAV